MVAGRSGDGWMEQAERPCRSKGQIQAVDDAEQEEAGGRERRSSEMRAGSSARRILAMADVRIGSASWRRAMLIRTVRLAVR